MKFTPSSNNYLLKYIFYLASLGIQSISFAALSLSVSPSAISPGGFDITGSCDTGMGKPVLQFTPIQLTNSSYSGPKYHQPTWVTHAPGSGGIPSYFSSQSSAQQVLTGPANLGCGHSGSRGLYTMKKSDWAKGKWKIKLIQGLGQSPSVFINII